MFWTYKHTNNYKKTTRKLQENYKDRPCSFLVNYKETTRKLQRSFVVYAGVRCVFDYLVCRRPVGLKRC